MIDRYRNIVNLPIEKKAESLIYDQVDDFAARIIAQARLTANAQGDNVVLERHVREALEHITRQQKSGKVKQLMADLGNIMLGAFLTGFVTEVTINAAHLNVVALVVWVIAGLGGLAFTLIGHLAA